MQLTLRLGQAQVLVLAFLFEQRGTGGMQRRNLKRGSVTASVRKGVIGIQNAATDSVLPACIWMCKTFRSFPHTPQISYMRSVGFLLSGTIREHP